MADYTGKLKDFSAIELGAIAARGAMQRTGVPPADDRPRRFRQRAADQRRRRLRRAARRPQSRRPGRSAGADGQPPVRLRHPGGHQRRADDPAWRSGRRAHRRDGEHEPGAARHPRPAQRAAPRTGPARRHIVVCPARHALRLHDGGDGGELRRELRRSRARSRTDTRFAASSWRMPRGGRDGCAKKSCRSKSNPAKASRCSRRTTTCARIRRSRGWRSSPPPSARTAASRPETPPASSTAAPRCCSPRRPRVSDHGMTPLARLTHWAIVGVEPTLMGMGPVPATRLVLRRPDSRWPTSISSRSTRPSRRNTCRSRSSSDSIASASTSTAALSRSAIRSE